MLRNDRLLLIVVDRPGNLLIFLEPFAAIDCAVKRERPRTLHRDKIGHDFLLAFDESKRMLAVCASTKVWFYQTTLLSIILIDDCSSSSTFSCSTATGRCRRWVLRSTSYHGTATECPFVMRASCVAAKRCSSLTPLHKQEYFHWLRWRSGMQRTWLFTFC